MQNHKTIHEAVGAHHRFPAGHALPDKRTQTLINDTLKNGYVIIPNAFTEAEVVAAKTELANIHMKAAAGPAAGGGRNTFEGFKTKRIYALLDKSRVFDKFVIHPDVQALNRYFLDPGFLLNAFHSINIQPHEDPQTLHHDDGFVTIPRPHRPFGTAIMVALDPYTESNGATVVIPKSHLWDDKREPQRSEAITVKMASGSLVYFLGTLWHGGGQNVSDNERSALTVQYCQPWVRPLENQLLAVSWDKLDKIPLEIVNMMGYKVGSPFIGYVDGVSPRRAVQALLERYNNNTSGKTKI